MSRHKYVRLGLSTVTTLLIILVAVSIIGTYSVTFYKSNFRFFKENVASSFVNIGNKGQESLVIENVAYHPNTRSLNVTLTNTGYNTVSIQNVTLKDSNNNVINTNTTQGQIVTNTPNSGFITSDSAANSGSVTVSSPYTITVSHHLGSSANKIVLVSVSQFSWTNPPATPTATYNSVSMTQILDVSKYSPSSGGYYVRTTILGLLDANLPGAGNYNATVTLSAATDTATVGVASFSGVDQTALPSNKQTATGSTGTSTPASVSITTQSANSLLFDTMTTIFSTVTAGSYQTVLWNVYYSNYPHYITGAASTKTTSSIGTYTMSWTESTDIIWALGVLELKPYQGCSSQGSGSIVLNGILTTNGTVSSSPYQITLSNFNVGTCNNRLLVVGVEANNLAVASLKFGGVSLTKAISHFTYNDAEFWYLKNPSGTGNIVVTMAAGSTSVVVGAYSFSGVDQTTPIPTTATNSNTPSSPTISITTKNPYSWVLDSPSIWGGKTLSSPTCTQRWNINIPSAITGASSSIIQASPGSVTCSWTASSGDSWDDVAIEVKPYQVSSSQGSGAVLNTQSLCGILPGKSCTISLGSYNCLNQPVSISVSTARGTTLSTVYSPVVAWNNSQEQFRKEIKINPNAVTSNLYNFTTLVNMTDTDLMNNALPNGNDIVFTACDGMTLLNYEIENYTSSTGSLVAWVKIPVLYNTPKNSIYMYYGNSNACNQQNAAGTWDSNYAAVYHLKENPAASNNSPIQLDNVQYVSTQTNGSGVAQLQNFAVGSGLYRLLVVGVVGDNAAVTSVSYGSQSLTQVTSKSNTVTGSIWYLINPSSCQSPTITVHATASKNMVIGAYSIFGADQTNPIPQWPSAQGSSGNPSVSITSGHPGSWVFDLAGIANTGGLTPTQTKKWSVTYNTITSASSKSGPLASSTLTTFTWTPNPSTNWIDIAIEVQAPYVPNLSLAGSVQTASSDSSKEAWLSLTLPSVTTVNNINRLLLVAVTADDNNVTSVTYGGALINHIIDVQAGTAFVAIWDMINPPIGTADIIATDPTNGGPMGIGAYSLYGVDTSNPLPTRNSTTGNCNPPPPSPCTKITLINAYKYGWVIDVAGLNTQYNAGLKSPTQTQQWSMSLPDQFTPSGEVASASSKNTATLSAVGTHTYFTWTNATLSNSSNPPPWPWAAIAVEIKNSTSLSVPVVIYDSTSNANNLTPTSMVAADQVPGKIGGALNFDGTSKYLSITSNLKGMPANNAAQTGSFWFWVPSTPGGSQDIYSLQKSSSSSSVEAGVTPSKFNVWKWGGTSLVSTSSLPTVGTWHYAAYTYDGTTHRLYIDGLLQPTSSVSPTTASPDSLYVGKYSGGQYYNGKLDELRISSIARSANWIVTEYNNQASPSTFFTVASPEMYAQPHASR